MDYIVKSLKLMLRIWSLYIDETLKKKKKNTKKAHNKEQCRNS